MKLKDIAAYMRDIRSPLDRDPRLHPDQTNDRVLHSLRRMRQAQLDDMEKQDLRKRIDAHQKREERERIIGESPFKNQEGFRLKRPPKTNLFAGRGGM